MLRACLERVLWLCDRALPWTLNGLCPDGRAAAPGVIRATVPGVIRAAVPGVIWAAVPGVVMPEYLGQGGSALMLYP